MRIESVEIQNILSIEKETLVFEDNGLVLVEGWNYDDGRANGAGKTAIFNAICFALYGKVPREITASEILRVGSKHGYALVSIMVGTSKFAVKRERPNKVTFYRNDVEEPMTQESFESKIKLTYDQFLVSMYIAQSASDTFIFKNDTQKKDFLLQLMNLKDFAACKKEVDKQISDLDKEIETLNSDQKTITSSMAAYSESIKDVKTLDDRIAHIDNEIALHTSAIKELQNAHKKPDLSKFNEVETSLRTKLDGFAELRAKRSLLMQEHRKLMAEDRPFEAKDPDAECPHCQGELNINGNSVVKADDKRAVKKQHDEHIKRAMEKASLIKQQIDNLDVELLKEKDVLAVQQKLRDKRTADYADYDHATSRIGELKSLIQRLESTSAAITVQIDDSNAVSAKIKVLSKKLDTVHKEIAAKSIEVELLEAVSSMYSSTGAQAYIMDSIVESFNESVTKYVDMIWPSASYRLNSYKEKKDGDVVAKFSETLVIGAKERSIGSLSGGELRALSLTLYFATIDILSKQFGMPLNPIIMDEPFEGLDAAGREIVIELLEKLSVDRQIWVVDHASEAKAMFSKTLKIEKRNGVSKIVH